MQLDQTKPETTKSDLAISEAMPTYWTNFAKYGHPNSDAVPKWEPFSEAKPRVMWFQQKPFLGPVPDEKSLRVLDEYFRWRRSPEGAAWAK